MRNSLLGATVEAEAGDATGRRRKAALAAGTGAIAILYLGRPLSRPVAAILAISAGLILFYVVDRLAQSDESLES